MWKKEAKRVEDVKKWKQTSSFSSSSWNESEVHHERIWGGNLLQIHQTLKTIFPQHMPIHKKQTPRHCYNPHRHNPHLQFSMQCQRLSSHTANLGLWYDRMRERGGNAMLKYYDTVNVEKRFACKPIDCLSSSSIFLPPPRSTFPFSSPPPHLSSLLINIYFLLFAS